MSVAAPHYRTGRAVTAIVLAVLALSLGDALIKATGLSLPLWQMYILRSALVVPVLWWLASRNGPLALQAPGWVLLRSVLLVVMWISYYVSLPLLPLSLASAAYYTGPLFILALAALIARRWPTMRSLTAITGGLAGVWLIFRPDTEGFQAATTLPILAAFLYACAMIVTSTKCRDDNPFVLALGLNMGFIIAGLLLGLFAGDGDSFLLGPWQPIDTKLIGVVAALALFILVGSVGAAIAYQNGPPATVAAFDYSYLVFSVMWGSLFFGESLGLLSALGIAIIIAAGMVALPTRKSAD